MMARQKSSRLLGGTVAAAIALASGSLQSRSEPSLASAATPQPGMVVLSANGEKVGTVESIDAVQDGRVTAVDVISPGFLTTARRRS
jgi:hypothetical protein